MLIMLIELGILVLPQSRTKAVDVGINYANQTTTGQREQFFKARYLVGRVFLNLVFFWSLPFRFSDPLCYVFFLVCFLTGAVLYSSRVFTCILA